MDDGLLSGDIVADTMAYSLVQACMICGVTCEQVVGLVAFGVVAPDGDRPGTWRFSESAIHRVKKALRLHRDLGLDLQGLALSLELLDEIDRLQALVDAQRWGDHPTCVPPPRPQH